MKRSDLRDGIVVRYGGHLYQVVTVVREGYQPTYARLFPATPEAPMVRGKRSYQVLSLA